MLKISTRDRQSAPHQASTNSSPFIPFRSNLTAALQASGNGNAFTQRLSPVSQVSDLAGRGGNEEQQFSALNVGFSELNGDPGADLIDQLPQRDDTAYIAPHNGPWNHLYAFSAPEPHPHQWSGLSNSAFETAYPGSPDALGSLQGSWTLNHFQSSDVPYQDASYNAANGSQLAFDDFALSPVEQRDLHLGHAQPFGNLDRSRASSISNHTYARSPRVYPHSSNWSVDEENAFKNPLELLTEDIDTDEKADTSLIDGFTQVYQANNDSILDGLKSPVHQQHSLPSGELIFTGTQGMPQWQSYDHSARKNLENGTEMFPELPEVFGPSFRPLTPGSDSTHTMSNPPPTTIFIDTPNLSIPFNSHQCSSPHEDGSKSQGIPVDVVKRARRITLPTASTPTSQGDQSVLLTRSPSNKVKIHGTFRRQRRRSLNENRKSLSLAQPPLVAKKGIRNKPLAPSQAEQVKKKRQGKLICIRCRIKRITCSFASGHKDCQHCEKQGSRCTRADFAEMTSAQSCNFIFQTSLSHITRDGQRRITIPYPAMIDADGLLNQLAIQHTRMNIEINSITGAVWAIDLSKCYEVLLKLPWQNGARRLLLDDLVHNRRIPLALWLECIIPALGDDEFEQLLKYTNMPNRNEYAIIFLGAHEQRRPLDVQHSGDRDLILMSAQLCRIILRALELRGFRTLQTDLGNISRLQNVSDKELIVYHTGQLVGTLRWRLGWWKLNGNGMAGLDVAFLDRVEKITWSLYCWYLFAKQQLPEDIQDTVAKGAYTYYVETEETYDEFPLTATTEEFERWLHAARSLIENSLASAPPTSLALEHFTQSSEFSEDATPPHNPYPDYHLPLQPRQISYDDSETNLTYEFAYLTQSV